MWFGHELLKGLSCSYDAAKDLLITFMMNRFLSMWNLVDQIFAGPTNPQGLEKEEPKERFEQGKARRDDSREE